MISKVKLVNVQSHVDSTIKFSPGVNVITGPSDVGKSAVIRALIWAARNKPSGESLRRHGTKETYVILDGVKKFRSSSEHSYEVEGENYKALRSDVPPIVEQTLGLQDENFQSQHEAYFLISDTPGQVAKTLNKVADLEIIDYSRKDLKQKLKVVEAKKNLLIESKEAEETRLASLQWIVEADREYCIIEGLENEAKSIDVEALKEKIDLVDIRQADFTSLPSVIDDKVTLEKLMFDLDVDLSLGDLIKKVDDNIVNIPNPTDDILSLIELQEGLDINTESIEELINGFVTALDDVQWLPLKIDSVDELVNDLEQVEEEIETIKGLVAAGVRCDEELNSSVVKCVDGEREFETKLKTVGACPLCGGQL